MVFLRPLFVLAVLLGLGLAQYESRLIVGAQEGRTLYPGGGSVAFGRADFIAESLGLGVLVTPSRLYLSRGGRVAVFGISAQGADASRFLNAYRFAGELWVPVRQLARQLDLMYRIDYGAPVVALKPARLLEVTRASIGSVERYVLRFDRDVQARVVADNPPRVAMIGVEEVPDAPQSTGISFSRENWGQEIYLPQGRGAVRIFYLPNQVVVERGETKRWPRVVLDAGHGGEDAGVKVGTLAEKDLVLSVVNRIRTNFSGRGVEVVLTRSADRAVPLAARAQFASTAQVFISVHAAAGSRVSIYSYPEVQTLRLLERGRELNSRTPASQKPVLERYVAAPGSAARFAQGISEAFAAAGIVANSSLDAMFVLSQAGGAAVMVELGFEQLRTPQGRNQAAEILTNAILAYLGLPANPPSQSPTQATPPQQDPRQGGNRP